MSEIRNMNVLRAREMILHTKYDEYMWKVELLSVHGYNPLDHKSGENKYKAFFCEYRNRNASENEQLPPIDEAVELENYISPG